MNQHVKQWQQIQTAFSQGRMAQAFLLVGPEHCGLNKFVGKIMQLLVCSQPANQPCGMCADCSMLTREEHPDVQWLKAEKAGGVIKIDQVRELQSTVYLTPQRARYRIIAIEAADRMNTASANALLKILEEPPKHSIFLLAADQISSILPTILSRCQLMAFSGVGDSSQDNLLALGAHCPEGSARALVIKDAQSILESLIAVLHQKKHPCAVAALWNSFELAALLWFLYLVYAQLYYMHIWNSEIAHPAASQLAELSTLLNPVMLLKQIEQINTLLRKINHNINMNQTLVLEDLLFSLVRIS